MWCVRIAPPASLQHCDQTHPHHSRAQSQRQLHAPPNSQLHPDEPVAQGLHLAAEVVERLRLGLLILQPSRETSHRYRAWCAPQATLRFMQPIGQAV